jgi:predicted metal-dependent phosphoesterase TrpH
VSRADLHLHSTASDGAFAPAEVARRAAAAGLAAVAITDHDTIAGVAEARAQGEALGLRVVAGCEFSVSAAWGEMHLLAYCLPESNAELDEFLSTQRSHRTGRMVEIVRRLNQAGLEVAPDDVRAIAGGGAIGRPHVARALVARGLVRDLPEAFDRYLGQGRAAFVPKQLPSIAEVTRLVRGVGGVTSAAHLKDRGNATTLGRLRDAGVDAVEVRHPAHDREAQDRLSTLARERGMLMTGGTDWHGEVEARRPDRAPLGTITVPLAWLEDVERLHRGRLEEQRHE